MMLPGSQSYRLYDAKGNLRVKLGMFDEEPVAKYMYHFTHDGEYVDGVYVTAGESNDDAFLRKLANTYEGCHAWALTQAGTPTWMQMVAVALPYERWQSEATASVPECVQTAEFVRDKS